MQGLLLLEERSFALRMSFIVHATINGANGCALWFVMKTYAFRTLIGYDVKEFFTLWGLFSLGIVLFLRWCGYRPLKACAIGKTPWFTAFVYSIVGAFRFASTTIDAFFSDLDRHLGGFRNFG